MGAALLKDTMTTTRLEIRNETGTWVLELLPDCQFKLTFQEVSVGEAKWRCTVASGHIQNLDLKMCEEHKHKVPVEVFTQLDLALHTLICATPQLE
jgi:hypothetical protein